MQARVITVLRQQLSVGAALDDLALVHHQNQVGFFDGRQAVSDDQRGATFHDLVQRRLNMALGFGVEGRGGLVEDQQWRVFQQCPRNRQALTLTAREQHAVFPDLGIQAFGHLRDEVHRISIGGSLFNVFARRASQIAISDVVGDAVVEQRHMLGHLGHMPAQVTQAIVFDLNVIEQNFADVVMIETRNQAGQGRLAATGTADQCHHLPRRSREADVFQHFTLGPRIREAEVTHLQMTLDPITLDRAVVDFRLDVQLLENAFGTGDAFLDGRTDFRQLANRLWQQAGGGNVGHQITGSGITAQEQHQEHQHGHGGVDHQLQHRRVDRTGLGHAQLLVGVALAGGGKATLFIGLTAEAAHHAIALNGFGRHVCHVAHRHLDLLALLAEFLAGAADHDRDDRQDRQHHQGQLPVHPQQVGKQEHHGQAFANDHFDGIRGSTGDHGHVEGDTRNQVPGVMRIKVAVGQYQQLVEQLDTQVMDQAEGNLGQVVVAQKRPKALPRGNQYDQQRHGLQQLQIAQIRNSGEQHRFRIAQPVHKIFEDPGEHWLSRGENHEADNTECKHAPVRAHIRQQAQVNLQARRRRRIRASHENPLYEKRARECNTGHFSR
ncbi:hypothetical protein D3C84_487010 [compost metagenome]